MAQYKVPQDVEAEDKLLGPFTFRQFTYLLIAGILVAIGVGLFQIFPVLAIIPLPPVLLLAALALPLKKDQPMETYLAAVISYYIKPRNRTWMPGQKETTINITAPKVVDDSRARGITSEEATHRLSFLADIVDTGGYAIKGIGSTRVNAELVAEASAAHDMFETNNFSNLESAIVRDQNKRHEEVVQEMKQEIEKVENMAMHKGIVKKKDEGVVGARIGGPNFDSSAVVMPDLFVPRNVQKVEEPVKQNEEKNKVETKPTNPSIIDLANNTDYSVATIAKEANRIKERDEGEVFISLH